MGEIAFRCDGPQETGSIRKKNNKRQVRDLRVAKTQVFPTVSRGTDIIFPLNN
jgi:hypothetical protein